MANSNKPPVGRGGARAGAGRKPKEAHVLLNKILNEVKYEDWKQMAETCISMAKAGSTAHLTLLFNYQFGKPVERQEVSGPDGGPLKHEHRDGDEESIIAAADAIKARRARLPSLP